GRSNVISGDFFDKGVEAWAALCARDGRSVPLVFHDQEDRDPTALGSIADPVCRATQAQCGFQAQIKAVPPDQIRLYDREVSGLTPPPIERQGIEIVQPGEPTVVRYLHDGVWLELIRPPSQ
ncbi:MAG: hypothetical protein KDC27_11440, partial [Acidobacteria bacterium]|nr:hypothetical protein [Acidobacteriota bacterium]